MTEEKIDENYGVKEKDIQHALDELRRNEIKLKVKELKAKLPNIGRCNICTLRVPCKHYKKSSEIPRESNLGANSAEESQKIPFDVTQYLPNITPNAYHRGFTVRSRGRATEYNLDFTKTNGSLPNEKRLKDLEKIESYKEEKLRKEIEKISAIKKEEELKKAQQQKIEEMKKKYLEKQKIKIEEYKKNLSLRDEEMTEIIEAEKEKIRKKEEKKRIYYEKLRRKIEEYHENKKILKQISKHRVKELVENVVNYKTIKIKRLR